ncbi:hypothetical protein INT45_009534 [Circinella minor]|uniref:BHLH domain-containing protein n=1 Tax=Circinella minor TaxID=1195481 RepID=A0A8H7S988_9FUNG|nr:hypothetical protein INT45_009534 [Circinella minor]
MGRELSNSSSPISPLTPTKTDDLGKFLFPGQEGSSNKKQQCRRPRSLQNKHQDHITSSHTTNGGKAISSIEIRRQIHIQSEQKRRAQIKDGFEELRNQLPTCLNKKMSKVTLLHRTVQHIQHLKSTQVSILAELERLVRENEELRKFQTSITLQQDPPLYGASTSISTPCSNTSSTTTTHQHQPLLPLSSSIATGAPISTQLYRES